MDKMPIVGTTTYNADGMGDGVYAPYTWFIRDLLNIRWFHYSYVIPFFTAFFVTGQIICWIF